MNALVRASALQGGYDGGMEDVSARPRFRYSTAILLTVAAIALPFLPLVLAVVEGKLFGTFYVEDACSRLGLHGVLKTLYETCGVY